VPVNPGVLAQGASANAFAAQLCEDNGVLRAYSVSDTQDLQVFNAGSPNILGVAVSGFGLTLNALQSPSGSGTITCRYFPSTLGPGPTLVSFGGGQRGTTPIASLEGAPILVKVNWQHRPNPSPTQNAAKLADIQVLVNDQEVFAANDLPIPSDGEASRIVPFAPYFGSTASGQFRIEVQGPNASAFAEYIQRGLRLGSEPEDYEVPAGENITISNSFSWDGGTEPNALQESSWEVDILNPDGAVIETFTGVGTQISAVWDTSTLGLQGGLRLRPRNRSAQDGGSPIYSYRVRARALAYPAQFPGSSFARPAVFYEYEDANEPSELRIINIEIEPNPPFQIVGESVNLTAEILAVGLGELIDDDIEWWVDLIDGSGNPVGGPLATGNGFEVSATWDGKVGGELVEDPSSYTLRISAITVCDAGPNPQRVDIRAQAADCRLAQAEVRLTGPRMIVSAVVEDTGPMGPTESEKNIGVSFSPAVLTNSGAKASQQLRRDLLGMVHTLKVADDAYKVDIEVQVVFPEDVDPSPQLLLQMRNMLTGAMGETIIADRRLDEDGFIYLAESVLLSREFVDADPGGTSANTRYSIGEFYRDKAKLVNGRPVPGKLGAPGVSNGATEAFIRLVENSSVFASPKTFLGKFAETAIVADVLTETYPDGAAAPKVAPASIPPLGTLSTPPLDDPVKNSLRVITSVTSDPKNLITTGFVPIEFTVKDDAGNKNPEPLMPVYAKVARFPGTQTQPSKSANVMLWTYHGDDHENGTVHPSSDYDRSVPDADAAKRKNWVISPSTPGTRDKLESVQTLILTGCSILDINDYNNGFVEIRPDGSYDLANQRNYGGEKWDEAMQTATKSGGVVLGYNDVSPLLGDLGENRLAELMELFESELSQLSSVPSPERLPWAWMSANVKLAARAGLNKRDSRWVALHASAIDKDFYYYIPQNKLRGARIPGPGGLQAGFVTFETDFGTVQRARPVWRVARYPAQPSNPLPPGSPPPPQGAVREWGVYYPGQLDLFRYIHNRDNFASPVPIPGLSYPFGGTI
jgi:hypothetical protein